MKVRRKHGLGPHYAITEQGKRVRVMPGDTIDIAAVALKGREDEYERIKPLKPTTEETEETEEEEKPTTEGAPKRRTKANK